MNNIKADIKKRVLGLKPFNSRSYEPLDLDRLVIYTMFFLEKKKIPLYFEYITVALFKLFPSKFSMAHFKQYPDAYRINNAVRRLSGGLKSKATRWASGSVEKGFSLTDTGREITHQVDEILKHPSKQKVPIKKIHKRSRGRSPNDDVEEIAHSKIFNKWQKKDFQINDYEILSFLKAVPYTPKELLLKYLEQLKESAIAVGNKQVLRFLNWLEKQFGHIFH